MNNIGILDPLGKYSNPLNNKSYSDNYKQLATKWSLLPAYQRAVEIIDDIKKNQIVLIVSATGSGKTVLIPKFCLHAFDYNKKILITLPKKIITESAAAYSAATLDVNLGEEVGYKYKNAPKNTYNDNTKLLYATDGSVVSLLLKDPLLSEYNAVIIDEAHERKIQIDFLLYLLKNTIKSRKDFKLIIMSATINEKVFTDYFGDIKVLFLEGTPNFPIKSIYLNKPNTDYLRIGLDILNDLAEKNGDIIFFVPSISETFKICDKVREQIKGYCIETFSGMNIEKQKFIQDKKYFHLTITDSDRRIIIATNVAESSLTIDGIEYVIDSGHELFNYYDPIKHAKVLEKKLITKSQVKQRMGRTGRTSKGTCYHLYTREEYDKMEEYPLPSIRVSNISFETLKLLKISDNIDKVREIFSKFIEPPSKIYLDSAIKDLDKLNLMKNGKINQLGSIIIDLKTDLMTGLALFAGYQLNCLRELTAIFSMLEVSKSSLTSLFNINKSDKKLIKHKQIFYNKYGDHLSLLNIFNKYRKDKKEDKYDRLLNNNLLSKALTFYKKYKQLFLNILEESKIESITNDYSLEERILASILFGFKLNIAYNDNGNYYRVNGIKAKVDRDSFLSNFTDSVVYNELVNINGSMRINIVSTYPKQVNTIVLLLTNKALIYLN